MTQLGVPGSNRAPLAYADDRLAVIPVVTAVRSPTVDDKKYPLFCEWRVNKDASLGS